MRKTIVMVPVAALSVLLGFLSGCTAGGAPAVTPHAAASTTGTGPAAAITFEPRTPPAPNATTTRAGSCPDTATWGTGTRQSALTSTAALYQARIGRHDCFDRVVFDVNGPGAVGYRVGYVPVVGEEGSGRDIPVPGGAALEVVVNAPAQGTSQDTSGHQPGVVFAPSGQYLYGPAGLASWGALRAVRSAGSFEGQSSFAVGVRDKLPFTVTTSVDGNQIAHVIVDIAHS
ncbi:MAG TPA: hypothetical protein VGJ13_15260 [Pseudonocardiaceae bacterium]|jgi:hypothetical protein